MVDASHLLLVHFILEARAGSTLAGVPKSTLRAQLLDAAAAIDVTVLAADFEPDHGHVFAAIKPSQTVDFVWKRLKSGLVKPLIASGALPSGFGWKGGSVRAYSVSASKAPSRSAPCTTASISARCW